uniref:non-specific serine/threonine protein kinase n=1 Tax=Cajanus cajan TaxID=3821 RepID=A0A151S5Z6_CAJCA|nr:putative LRR receptor-like serine/threonine-protein kinase At4g08850 family [Cajanus cajan]
MSYNTLKGKLPPQIGDLSNLNTLDLSTNKLSGNIPNTFTNLSKLMFLNLSFNGISGPIPKDVGKLRSLVTFDIFTNNLTGPIPDSICTLPNLESIHLFENQLSGSIPFNIGNLSKLTMLSLSTNKLTGKIPPSVGNLTNAKVIFITIVLPLTVVTLILAFFALGVVYGLCKTSKEKQVQPRHSQTPNIFAIWSFGGKMVFENIIEATEHFDSKYLIGVGGQGCVYKATLPTGQVVAVKKLHSFPNGEMLNLKAFTSEIQALTEIRHRNIMKLYGFCSHSQISFLVCELLEKGDVKKILKDDEQAIAFDWTKRVNVVKDVASALCYMHHDCTPPIVHRDISSKNVLLDSDYVAHVSDFGTAKFLNPNSSNWTSFVGTFGYAPPELAYTMEVNEKCDVYSFGVLAWEILYGRHPGDDISNFVSSSMGGMASTLDHMTLMDKLDERLPHPTSPIVKEVISIAKVAISCLAENPRSRPSMEQVTKELAMANSSSMPRKHPELKD